jgi:hypothetical protein
MKRGCSILLVFSLILLSSNVIAQHKSSYTQNGTTYIYGESYSTTGKPKVERSSTAKKDFLKSMGLKKIPAGYQIDHIKPLSEGGSDTPSNMQLISVSQHKRKTGQERANTSSTYRGSSYKSSSTYKSYPGYSTPSYSNKFEKTIYTGPKGGKYYYNGSGKKVYMKK